MFNLFSKKITDAELADVRKRMKDLEQYLGIEYFNGTKHKSHYRKQRTKVKRTSTVEEAA